MNDAENAFVVIQPDEDDPVWFESVDVLKTGGYEIVRRDTSRREHDVTVDGVTWVSNHSDPAWVLYFSPWAG